MNVADWLAKVTAFVRTGYPRGIPKTDYSPLLALLRRRPSDDEAAAEAQTLTSNGIDTAFPPTICLRMRVK